MASSGTALLDDLAAPARAGFERSGGDRAWGVAPREERGLAYRKAMSGRRPR